MDSISQAANMAMTVVIYICGTLPGYEAQCPVWRWAFRFYRRIDRSPHDTRQEIYNTLRMSLKDGVIYTETYYTRFLTTEQVKQNKMINLML